MQQRPTGITILAILAALGGLLGLMGVCTLLGVGGLLGGALAAGGAAGAGALVGGLSILFSLYSIAVCILDLVFAYGAWYLKPWAWMLGIISQGLSLLQNLINIFNGESFFGQLIGILISGAILYYLFTPEVKRAFGRA